MSTGLLVSIGAVVITLAVCGLIVWFMLKGMKKQAWQGTVVSKGEEEVEGASEFSSTSYALIVKLDNGNQKNVKVGKKIWEQFKEGDKIVKEPGKLNPTKAS